MQGLIASWPDLLFFFFFCKLQLFRKNVASGKPSLYVVTDGIPIKSIEKYWKIYVATDGIPIKNIEKYWKIYVTTDGIPIKNIEKYCKIYVATVGIPIKNI